MSVSMSTFSDVFGQNKEEEISLDTININMYEEYGDESAMQTSDKENNNFHFRCPPSRHVYFTFVLLNTSHWLGIRS